MGKKLPEKWYNEKERVLDREETADELSTIIQSAIFGLVCFLVLGVLPSMCLIF